MDEEGVHWRLLREGFAHKCKDCMFRTQDDKMKEIVQVIYICLIHLYKRVISDLFLFCCTAWYEKRTAGDMVDGGIPNKLVQEDMEMGQVGGEVGQFNASQQDTNS